MCYSAGARRPPTGSSKRERLVAYLTWMRPDADGVRRDMSMPASRLQDPETDRVLGELYAETLFFEDIVESCSATDGRMVIDANVSVGAARYTAAGWHRQS